VSTAKLNTIILNALGTMGTFEGALKYMFESLTPNEYRDTKKFFKWLQLHNQTIGHGNIVSQWSAFYATIAKKSADKEYHEAFKAVEAILKAIPPKIKAHAESQKKDKKNWGYVGDINALKASLEEIVTSIENYGE
jgi:hypothetical protein